MSSKWVPSNPSDVMVIRDVTPNIVALSVPFLRNGMFKVGGRGTLIKLTSGALVVFSPVAHTPEVKAKVEALGGKLAYIIAADIEHHLFVSEWKAAYPDAKIIGPEGMPEKRAKQHDERVGKEPFDVVFTAKNKGETSISAEFDADLDVEYVDGHVSKEIVLFHRADKFIVEADLLFNLPATEQYSRVPAAERDQKPNVLQRLFYSLQSTAGDAKAQKRLIWYFSGSSNRKSFNESIARIDQWDFDGIIPCHGEIVTAGGKDLFRKVFSWQLTGTKN